MGVGSKMWTNAMQYTTDEMKNIIKKVHVEMPELDGDEER
jgi:hypothetical protein